MNDETDRDLSALYRSGADELPPPRLDRRIELAARKAVRPSPLRMLLDILPRWQYAMGAAAVVTLSVSLVLTMKEEAPSVFDHAEPPRRAAESGPDQGPVAPAPVPPDASAGAAQALRAQGEPGAPAVLSRQVQPEAERASPVAGRSVSPEAPQSPPSALPKRSAPEVSSRDSSAPAPSAPVEAVHKEAVVVSAPAPAAVPAPANQAAVPSMKAEEGLAARGRLEKRVETFGAAPSAVIADETPEAWTKRLVDWLQQGRETEVREGLARFRQRYPAYPLPEALARFDERASAGDRSSSPDRLPSKGVPQPPARSAP